MCDRYDRPSLFKLRPNTGVYVHLLLNRCAAEARLQLELDITECRASEAGLQYCVPGPYAESLKIDEGLVVKAHTNHTHPHVPPIKDSLYNTLPAHASYHHL